VEFPAEEGQHVLGAQTEGGIPQEPPVERPQHGAIRAQHVGRVLGLVRRPVVAVPPQLVAQERIDPGGEAIEHGLPVQPGEAVGEPLHAAGMLEPEERILQAAVPEPATVHLPGQPLVAVDVHLHREGEPGLHAGVAEAELPIEEVAVQEQTLPPGRADRRAAVAVGQAKAAARLDRAEHADEAVAGRDGPGPLVLPHRRLEVLVGASRLLRHRVGMRLEALSLLEHERLQVLEQEAAAGEELLHRVGVAERQVPLEQQPVEAGQRPRCRRRMLGEKPAHGVLRLVRDEVRRACNEGGLVAKPSPPRGLTAVVAGVWLMS
jgi:hypothetical protein